jgi:transposase
VAKDLRIGRSSLSKWKSQFRDAELLAGPHEDVLKELARLRRENELLRAERDLLKNDRGPGPPYTNRGREGPIAFWW